MRCVDGCLAVRAMERTEPPHIACELQLVEIVGKTVYNVLRFKFWAPSVSWEFLHCLKAGAICAGVPDRRSRAAVRA